MRDGDFDLKSIKAESSLAVSRLSEEQLRLLFPLNTLSSEQLNGLRPSMSVKPMRANRELFKVGDTPEEAYWLIDGVIQLMDAKEERLEAVTAGADIMMPLPYVLPAVEAAQCVVDCRFVALNRQKLNEILKKQHVDPRLVDKARGRLRSSEQLFREFEQLREAQQTRLRMQEPDDKQPDGGDQPESVEIHLPSSAPRAAPVMSYGHRSRSAYFSKPSERDNSGDVIGKEVGSADLKRAFDALGRRPGYRNLPINLRAECLMKCELVEYQAREIVVTQGEASRFWYMILQGDCEVSFAAGDACFTVNHYKMGDSFGEDGLLTDQPRNASVVATSDLRLLRLSKENFCRFLMKSFLHAVTREQVRNEEFVNALWVDLRLPSERDEKAIRDALEVPWPLMRSHPFPESSDSRNIVLVAMDGTQAKPIAYMLRKFGYHAYYLEGGFTKVPEEKLCMRSTNHRPAPGGIVRIQ